MATPPLSPANEAVTLRHAIQHAEHLQNLLEYLQRLVPGAYRDDGQIREIVTGLRARLADLGPQAPTIICRRSS